MATYRSMVWMILLAGGIFATPGALAGDPGVANLYRLRVEDPAAFRLPGVGPDAQDSDTRPAIPPQLADKPFTELIENAARKAALDPALVHAVIQVESGYNPKARSSKGALGLMQVMPDTAARYGVANPAQSIEANLSAGTRYLRDLVQMFDERLDLALAAYNAGENAVLRHGNRIPPYRETQQYVPAVLAKYREWRAPPPPAPTSERPRTNYLPGTTLDSAVSGAQRPRY